jgi:hypothetical protein
VRTGRVVGEGRGIELANREDLFETFIGSITAPDADT